MFIAGFDLEKVLVADVNKAGGRSNLVHKRRVKLMNLVQMSPTMMSEAIFEKVDK